MSSFELSSVLTWNYVGTNNSISWYTLITIVLLPLQIMGYVWS